MIMVAAAEQSEKKVECNNRCQQFWKEKKLIKFWQMSSSKGIRERDGNRQNILLMLGK